MGYVLKVTLLHMRDCVEKSINKTSARIEEFADDHDKSSEIFRTLAYLHKQRQMLNQQLAAIE